MSKRKPELAGIGVRVNGGDEVTFTPEALENLAKHAGDTPNASSVGAQGRVVTADELEAMASGAQKAEKVADLQAMQKSYDEMQNKLDGLKEEQRELKRIMRKTDEAIREHIRDLDKPPQPTLYDEAEVRDGE